MAAPTAAAAPDTAAPPPPPPAEPAAAPAPDHKVSPPPPQPDAPAPAPVPAPAPAPAPAPKKRKLEEAGFHSSDYYKIRAVVADLRVRFVQVYQSTDFRNTDAAREILKEINVVMDLSKKMRVNLGATSEFAKLSEKPSAGPVKDDPMKLSAGTLKDEPAKPSEKPSAEPGKDEPMKPSEKPSAAPAEDEPVKPLEKPSAEPVKDVSAGPALPGENNQAPPAGQTVPPPNSVSDDAPIKLGNPEAQQ